MNVFIGMECSGTIADAFARHGHSAISCDLNVGENKLSNTSAAMCSTRLRY